MGWGNSMIEKVNRIKEIQAKTQKRQIVEAIINEKIEEGTLTSLSNAWCLVEMAEELELFEAEKAEAYLRTINKIKRQLMQN